MAKKMTKKDMFAQIMANYNLTEDEKAFIEHEIELLTKKSSGERKPTANQQANAILKDVIVAYMAQNPERIFTISELIKEVPELTGLSTQKVSPLMYQLVDALKVTQITEKRKSYFQFAE